MDLSHQAVRLDEDHPDDGGDGRVEGLNGYIRRLLFPHLPPTKCVGGVIWFPGGTGPFIPIPCDDGPLPQPADIPSPSRFVRKPGTAFVAAVAEQAGVSHARAARAIADAADVPRSDLGRMTVEEVGRALVGNAGRRLRAADGDGSFGAYVKELSLHTDDIQPSSTIAAVARQTGLEPDRLRAMPAEELAQHLDVLGDPGAPAVARLAGTTVCGTSGGHTQCGVVTGRAEAVLWGGIIGGVIGGVVGAVIGGVVGAIIDWLF